MTDRPATAIAGTPYDLLPDELLTELTAAGLDPHAVYGAITAALAEDLPADGPGVDVTSDATIPADLRGDADLAAREDGVVAGLGIAELVFAYVLGGDVEITDRVPDGTRVSAGDVVMRVSGPVRGLLTAERTALNFACHLSGVATATAAWVDALAGTRARVLDTTGSASRTWPWSRTTTSSPRAVWSRRSRPCAPATPTSRSRSR
jgi:nicotinate-nucleotide pyrophosphorylase (carboxylating)